MRPMVSAANTYWMTHTASGRTQRLPRVDLNHLMAFTVFAIGSVVPGKIVRLGLSGVGKTRLVAGAF